MPENRHQIMPLLSRFAVRASQTVGARHLEGQVCRPRHIPASVDKKLKEAETQGCGGESLFEIPVTGDEGGDFRKADPAVVCAVDDMAYLFPRYGGDEVDVGQ